MFLIFKAAASSKIEETYAHIHEPSWNTSPTLYQVHTKVWRVETKLIGCLPRWKNYDKFSPTFAEDLLIPKSREMDKQAESRPHASAENTDSVASPMQFFLPTWDKTACKLASPYRLSRTQEGTFYNNFPSYQMIDKQIDHIKEQKHQTKEMQNCHAQIPTMSLLLERIPQIMLERSVQHSGTSQLSQTVHRGDELEIFRTPFGCEPLRWAF